MTPEQWREIKEILQNALDLAPADRRAYLDMQPRDIAREVELLLDVYDRNSAFLQVRMSPEPPPADAEPALIDKQFGPYRVLRLLGHGGMGSVWLAERVDGLFARRVALKLVHSALMGRMMTERVTREREILASLNHPNIARLLDAGFAEDGQPYLALEYVAGIPLTTYCDARRLTIAARLELFRQVLSAVHYAHSHLVIHRDLKPSNILVTKDGQVQLLDFGIAKLLIEGEAKETELTLLGGRALTPDYAAPEQIKGAPLTTAADVYSLGVMLYELLTGERPYKLKRDSRGALEEAILQAEPMTPSRIALSEAAAQSRGATAKKLAWTLRGDLDTIVCKALKKLPGERYATADAFSEDVARYLRGEVVLAQRDTVSYRALKFVQRNWIGLSVASILILTLAGGLAATSYEARVAAAQRDAALQAQLSSLTQTAAARLKDADSAGAMGIILEVLQRQGPHAYTPQALSVFHEARAADPLVLGQTGLKQLVRSASFSPDGRRLVAASDDGTAAIMDTATGRWILVLRGHTAAVNCAAFSPDGRYVVTGSSDKAAGIWDSSTGREILRLEGHIGSVYSAAFSPDGRHVVTASADKTARLWDASTGREILRLNGHTDHVRSASISPDGRRLATASDDETARIWDAVTGRELQRLSGHTGRLYSVAFSPDGRSLVTASSDKTARIWDAATGREILRLRGHTGDVNFAEFSPDGGRLVTASDDKTARIWDATGGGEILRLGGHTEAVFYAAFSPDGRQLVTASADKTTRLWESASQEILLLSGHTRAVFYAAFSPDGRLLATASPDKTCRIWDTATGRQMLLLDGHTDGVNWAAFSPDGRRLVTASLDRTIRVWEAATGRQILLISGHTNEVQSAVFSPDGARLLSASVDGTARIWDAVTGREVLRLAGHTDRVLNAAFSPDASRIVTASQDGTARIWDAATGRQLRLLAGHTANVSTAAFSPDGRRLVTASADKTARIWDAASGRQILLLSGHSDKVNSAEFSPDGRWLATASDDKTARIWDAVTGQQVLLLSGHTDGLEAATYSPDGRRLATVSDDQSVRIWDASVPAFNVLLRWAEAAQFDPLSSTERFELGLDDPNGVRRWPPNSSKCDELSAAPYDPGRRAPGVPTDDVIVDIAVAACANDGLTSTPQTVYQHARALLASGKISEAKSELDAVAGRYPAAQVDLAMLLTDSTTSMGDLPRAIRLYEHAWKDGVTIAAFNLGALHEYGVRAPGNEAEYALAPDQKRAWLWYGRGADAGEPNALARFAEKSDAAAFAETDAARKNHFLLEAFRYYAAAAERARKEDWPDDAWRKWRYRRASLARLLAREGSMRDVADAYDSVLKGFTAPSTAIWERLVSSAGTP